jgi:hypothetical protein
LCCSAYAMQASIKLQFYTIVRLLSFFIALEFLQVTNPAIDPFRESCVTSLRTFIGPEGDVSTIVPEHAYRLELDQPVLTLTEMAAIKRMDFRGWHTNVIDTTYDCSMGNEGLLKSLLKICQAAERAISWGYQILVRCLPVTSACGQSCVLQHRALVKSLEG